MNPLTSFWMCCRTSKASMLPIRLQSTAFQTASRTVTRVSKPRGTNHGTRARLKRRSQTTLVAQLRFNRALADEQQDMRLEGDSALPGDHDHSVSKWMHRELIALKEVVGSREKVGLGTGGVVSTAVNYGTYDLFTTAWSSAIFIRDIFYSSLSLIVHNTDTDRNANTDHGGDDISSRSRATSSTRTRYSFAIASGQVRELVVAVSYGPGLEYQHQLQHQRYPRERKHTVSQQTPPPMNLRHIEPELQDTHAPQPQDRKREDDTCPSTDRDGMDPAEEAEWIAALVPHHSPLPASSSSTRKSIAMDDSDLEREIDRDVHERKDEQRSSSPVLRGMDVGGRRSRSGSNSVTSSAQTLKPVHYDTESHEGGDEDVDMDMRSAPAPRTPTRRSTITGSPSSPPAILAVLALFWSNEGSANPPASLNKFLQRRFLQNLSNRMKMRRRNEKLWLGSGKLERRIRWAVSKVEKEASKEVEDKAVVQEVQGLEVIVPFAAEEASQLSPPAATPISQLSSAAALSSQKQLEVVQQQVGQMSRFLKPTLAAPSTSAPSANLAVTSTISRHSAQLSRA
ncbi:hypothetical protein CPC08DRAFT_730101, partial [Agrocybe pediades]